MVNLREQLSRFRMYTIHSNPCPIGKARGCRAAYEDTYGRYRLGCEYCDGKGTYTTWTRYHVGHLMSNVVAALWAERAFLEGHSAGVTDAHA